MSTELKHIADDISEIKSDIKEIKSSMYGEVQRLARLEKGQVILWMLVPSIIIAAICKMLGLY